MTNPSLKDFTEFIPSQITIPSKKEHYSLSRKSNYLLYSIYECKVLDKKTDKVTYMEFKAFAKNFSLISKRSYFGKL